MSFIHLLNKLYALVVQLLLFGLHTRKDINSCLGIHKFFRIEAILEFLDGVVLLELMELYHSVFPGLIECIKFGLLTGDDFSIESIKLVVLSLIFLIFVSDLLFHELVHLWLKVKSNINKLLSHATKVSAASLFLESSEIIKSISQIFNLIISAVPLNINFFPNTVNITNLVGEQQLIAKSIHKRINFDI